MVENKMNLQVKCLKSDNGREYIDDDFKWYQSKNEIKMTKTILRKSQQNGVAARMNKTLNEYAESMRIHAGLPNTFWVDLVNTTTHLINRGPLVSLDSEYLKRFGVAKR